MLIKYNKSSIFSRKSPISKSFNNKESIGRRPAIKLFLADFKAATKATHESGITGGTHVNFSRVITKSMASKRTLAPGLIGSPMSSHKASDKSHLHNIRKSSTERWASDSVGWSWFRCFFFGRRFDLRHDGRFKTWEKNCKKLGENVLMHELMEKWRNRNVAHVCLKLIKNMK